MKRIRPHLTYANVMVTLLAFVVLGGVAVAATTLPKNSVGNKQLKKNSVSTGKIRNSAVTGAKVADGSLTGADVVASTLGIVPQAERANTAGTATTAQSAESANTAKTAETAGSATTAQTASDADELGGEPPSAYAPSSRFFYVTVDPTAEPAKALFEVPGGVKVTTDGDNDKKFELVVKNSGPDIWSVTHTGLKNEEGKEEELPAIGGSLTFTPSPEMTALIMLQDRAEPEKAVALQCGLTFLPLRITCFATLSPALAP